MTLATPTSDPSDPSDPSEEQKDHPETAKSAKANQNNSQLDHVKPFLEIDESCRVICKLLFKKLKPHLPIKMKRYIFILKR